jgi:hypothetical protein
VTEVYDNDRPTESEGYKRKLRSSTSTAKRRRDLYDADDTGVEPMLLDGIDERADGADVNQTQA